MKSIWPQVNLIYNPYEVECNTPRNRGVYEQSNLNFFWTLIRIPPIELVVLPKGVFIKTSVLNPTIGNIILPKIISPPLDQEFDYRLYFNLLV